MKVKILSTIMLSVLFSGFNAQDKQKVSEGFGKKQISVKEAAELVNSTDSKKVDATIEPVVIYQKDEDKKREEEFMALMKVNEANKKVFSEAVLSEMMKADETDELSLLLVKNKSKCNMVLKVEGKKVYNIPVPAEGQNAIMVEKGEYLLNSRVCELKYESKKDLNKNLYLAIQRMND